MAVLPFAAVGRPAAPWSRAAAAGPVVAPVTGSFRSPSARRGTFTGSYRLEGLVSWHGRLHAAGVFTGELRDADGRRIGIGARRSTDAAELVVRDELLQVRTAGADIDLLGILVTVDELRVDVQGTCGEGAAREALRSVQSYGAPGQPAQHADCRSCADPAGPARPRPAATPSWR
jgi:hypothetical protein